MIISVHPYSRVGVDGDPLDKIDMQSPANPQDRWSEGQLAGLFAAREDTKVAGEVPITVIGNLTGEPELRFTQSGAPVVNFNVASTVRIYDREANEWKDGDTSFFRCNLWRQPAENVAESLKQGDRVIVSGRLKQRSYEKDGQKRSSWEIEVDEVGPSLKWATAAVNRAKRSKTESPRKPADDPWSSSSADIWSEGEPGF